MIKQSTTINETATPVVPL